MAGVIQFPGTAGNFISTDDVNLLDCDSSWFAQGTGGLWTAGVPDAAQSLSGGRSLLVAGGVSTAIAPVTDAAFFSLSVFSAAGDTFDINGGTPVVVPGGLWTLIKAAGNAGTYTVNAVGSADYYVDQVIVQSSDASFIPSLRVVGDFEFNMRAIVNALPGANQYMWNMWSGTASQRLFNLHVNASDLFSFTAIGTAALRSLAPAITEQAYDLRGTAVVGGVTELFIDTVSQGTNAGVTTATPSGPLVAGARSTGANNWEGDFFNANLQDGIGGPVVAALIPGEIPLPSGGNLDGASWTGGDGRTWQIHGNEVEIRTGGGLLGEYFMTDRRGNPRPKSSLTRKVRRA